MTLWLLLLFLQPPATAPDEHPEDLYEGLKRVMAFKQREWTTAHNTLSEASRKLSPCSPRIATLLKASRDAAGEAVKANTKYFARWGESLKQQVEEERKFAAESATNHEHTRALLDQAIQEGEAIQRRRQELEAALKDGDSKDAREALANLERMYTTNRRNLEEAVKSGAQVGELSKAAREQLAVKESLLGQIQGYEEAESRKWQAYYDYMEAEIRKRCSVSQQPGAPFDIPAMTLPAAETKKQ